MGSLLRGIGFVSALIFILSIALAQLTFPILFCYAPEKFDSWMQAFLIAPVGIPCLMMSILFLVKKIHHNSRIVAQAEPVFGYLLV
jgi:hypothetical protein